MKFFQRIIPIFFLFLFISNNAFAIDICGNDKDDDGDKGTPTCAAGFHTTTDGAHCDADCLSKDHDGDGYTTDGSLRGFDPNDNDYRVGGDDRPVTCTVSVAGDGWKMAYSDGTFGTCILSATTPYTCHYGTGQTYYIDFGSGSNANAGTYASPWKDTLPFTDYTQSNNSAKPGTWHRPVKGDCFVIKGSSNITTTFTDTGNGTNPVASFQCLDNTSGILSAPITLTTYPGSTAGFNIASQNPTSIDAIRLEGCKNWKVLNVKIAGTYGNGIVVKDTGTNRSRNVELARNSISGVDGNATNGVYGIKAISADELDIHDNDIFDNYSRATPASANNAAIYLDSGKAIQITYNNIYNTNLISGDTSLGIKQARAYYLDSSVDLYGNKFWNIRDKVVQAAGYGWYIRNNFVLNSGTAFWFGDWDSKASHQGGTVIVNNTIYNGKFLVSNPQRKWNQNDTAAGDICSNNENLQSLYVRNNVVRDITSSYGVGNSLVSIFDSGPDGLYNDVVGNGKLQFKENCYYNPNTNPRFAVFENNNGNTGCGGTGTSGAAYTTLGAWQAAGYDTSSVVETLTFDAKGKTTSSGCNALNAGYFAYPRHVDNDQSLAEICGDKIDNTAKYWDQEGSCPTGWKPAKDGVGCDKQCPTADADGDGHKHLAAGGDDCDDTDAGDYPGLFTTKGCTGGQVKKCQNTGLYTSCAAWSCPATGSGQCYYFSPQGSNLTGDGSIGNPWRDYGRITQKYDGSHYLPWTAHDPVPGDVYIFRKGAYNKMYDLGNQSSVFYRRGDSFSGTNVNRITWMNYPGEQALFNPKTIGQVASADTDTDTTKAVVYLDSVKYWKFEGHGGKNLKFEIRYGHNIELVNGANGSDYTEIRNMTGSTRDGNDNHANVMTGQMTGLFFENILAYNVYKKDRSDNPFNNGNMFEFRGDNYTLKSSAMWNDLRTPDSQFMSLPFKYKHANYTNSTLFENNTLMNGASWTEFAGSTMEIRYNTWLNNYAGAKLADQGGTSYQTGYMRIKDNTFINSRGVMYNPQKKYFQDTTPAGDLCSASDVTLGTLEVKNNIFYDVVNTLDAGENNMIEIGTYFPDSIYNEVWPNADGTSAKLDFQNNGYLWSGGSSRLVCLFCANNGNTTCAGYGNNGASYSFAGWQAKLKDTTLSGSVAENPTLDSSLRATAASSQNKGRIKLSDVCNDCSGGGGSTGGGSTGGAAEGVTNFRGQRKDRLVKY